MRIALRTSGGRGEYELAGRQGQINASDIFDRHILYELTPSIVIPGRAIATRVQGKPRIRLEDRLTTTHFYRLLAAVLLLPKPKREFRDTHGPDLLRRDAYSMTAIKVDVGATTAGNVVLRPTDLLLENADNLQARVSFAQRMARITQLWEAATTQNTALARLVQAHAQVVTAPISDHKAIEHAAKDIATLLAVDGDSLPEAERQLGVGDLRQEPPPLSPPAHFTRQAEFGVEDDISPMAARIVRLKEWRQVAIRGSVGSRFRREVSAAYDYRCLFTGQRLPRLEVTESAGVDAAHILPWSTHDLNSTRNGICLNKLCHWAFDEGVLRLRYDDRDGAYRLELPEEVRTAARSTVFDLDYFERLAGPIPAAHLPTNRAAWPSPNYLEELNRVMSVASV
jgi:putative restriction endonuclease